MTRIFTGLAAFSLVLAALAFGLGWAITDPSARDMAEQTRVAWHLLSGLAALVFAVLVHAIVLTYFMGTSRWLEETTQAYQLSRAWFEENRTLKYRVIPLQVLAIFLLILVGAFGGAADPASALGFQGWGGVSPATIHLISVSVGWGVNIMVYMVQYLALLRNGEIIQEAMQEVRRIRTERGLPV